MVALMKPREPRHYQMGPTSQDQPLRVYEPPARVPWAVDVLLAIGLFVFVVCPAVAAFFFALGMQ